MFALGQKLQENHCIKRLFGRIVVPLLCAIASEQKGQAEVIQQKTGLVLDAYFSATKLAWLIDWVKQNQPDTNWDNVMAGTVDSWALWNLTGKQVHATDESNASRTMLMNLDTKDWDESLLKLFDIPSQIMPEIKPSMGLFGKSDRQILGTEIPIAAIFGDQQASLFAHGCARPGLLKCTYGTGCFFSGTNQAQK